MLSGGVGAQMQPRPTRSTNQVHQPWSQASKPVHSNSLGDFFHADYGRAYHDVREARGYSVPVRPGKPPPLKIDLRLRDPDPLWLSSEILRAFGQQSVEQLFHLGGVIVDDTAAEDSTSDFEMPARSRRRFRGAIRAPFLTDHWRDRSATLLTRAGSASDAYGSARNAPTTRSFGLALAREVAAVRRPVYDDARWQAATKRATLATTTPLLRPGDYSRTCMPRDRTPSDHTPSYHTPSDHTPCDHTPSDHTPSDHTPSDHTPRDNHTSCDYHMPVDHHMPPDHPPIDLFRNVLLRPR